MEAAEFCVSYFAGDFCFARCIDQLHKPQLSVLPALIHEQIFKKIQIKVAQEKRSLCWCIKHPGAASSVHASPVDAS